MRVALQLLRNVTLHSPYKASNLVLCSFDKGQLIMRLIVLACSADGYLQDKHRLSLQS